MNVIHNLFEGVDIKVDLTPKTINKVYELFKQYNIECSVNNLRLLINGIITMNFSDINMSINETLTISETFICDMAINTNIIDSLILNELVDFKFNDINLNIKESLRQNENINMTFNDINMQCYGKLIISKSVGSTRSVTVGECKNLTMFEYYYYSDTLDNKVGTTKTVTVGDVKNITLYNYYYGTL